MESAAKREGNSDGFNFTALEGGEWEWRNKGVADCLICQTSLWGDAAREKLRKRDSDAD